jgi:hypothetical protein
MLGSKVLTKSIVLPVAQTAQKKAFVIDAPSDYKNVRGFYVYRNTGSSYLKIGVQDSAGNTVLEPVNVNHLAVGTTVAIKDKFFKETPFRADGTKITVTVENFATISGTAEDMDFIFLVDND